MKKWLPWIVVGVMAAWVISTMRPARESSAFRITGFGRLPVVMNGRVQPMDSVARNSLLQIRTKQTVPLEKREKLSAIEWLIEVYAKPEKADERKVFRIDHPEVLALLKLPEHDKYYSYNQIEPSVPEIDQQARRIHESKKEPQQQTPFEKQLLKLYSNLTTYQRLKSSLRPENSDDFARELEMFQESILPGVAAVRSQQAGREFNQQDFDRLLEMLSRYDVLSRIAMPLAVPATETDHHTESWVNVGTSLMESVRSQEVAPAVKWYAQMLTAYRHDKPVEFNNALTEYQRWLGTKYEAELSKARHEAFFNHFQPFIKSMVVYVLALLTAFFFWLNWSQPLRRSAVWLLALAFVIHTAGLLFRMILEGRPPVTNLYSSAIFVGWGSVGLGMILERIYRDGIGIVVAAIIGFTTLIIAHHLALTGDTMEMMRAVLDTNFWLATHVVVITAGYSAMFVAGLLAIVYIVRGVFTRSLRETTMKSLGRMVYGIVCFATLFSFVGTILGGIWADQSWGRFWGWDPKENGALLIVIWCATILHARWGGMIRERGLMCMAVFGNVITSFSWFGVNMLGIGLHSYGFMDAAFMWLMLFVASQIIIIALGLLPLRYWASFRSASTKASPDLPPSSGPAGGRTPRPAPAGS